MEKLIQLWSQNQTAFTVAAVVMLVLVLFFVRAGIRKYGKKIDPTLAEDLAKGDCEAAAERELTAGRLRSAYDLFVRAQQPVRAAQIAVRQGRLRDAAELFEKAGSRRRAAGLYKQVGMTLKAEELLAEEPAPASGKLALSDVAPSPAAPELNLGAEAKPATPSLFGLQALMDETAQKAASQAMALAATQASMASVAAAAGRSIVARGVEQEERELADRGGGPGAASPPPAAVPHDDAKAAVEPLALADAQPSVKELSLGHAKPDKEQLLTDSDPSLQAVASPPPAIVAGTPERKTRSARPTPRSPIPVVGSSVGAYRMVRPSEPEIFTPPPQVKTPAPQRPRPPSSELGSGERRQPTPIPTPRPRLSLAAKAVTGEPPLPRSRTPSAETELSDGLAPKTPSPDPGTGSKGTIPGIGRR